MVTLPAISNKQQTIIMKLLLVTFLLTVSLYFFSCQSSLHKEYASTTLTDSTSISGLTGDSVKLVKTAGINFKVKDVEKSTRSISALARKFGGMIYNQTFEAAEEGRNEIKISPDSIMVISTYTPQANITVRVPSENLEEFMYDASDIGYFTGSCMLNIDDKSLSFLENKLKQDNRTEVLALPENTKSKSLTKPQTIGLKDEVTDRQITNRTIDADVKYSSVQLNLSQNPLVRKEVIANYVISDYQLPFGKRLSDSLNEGWQFFLSFVLLLANCWTFILLILVIMISYRFAQHKRKITI